MTSSGRTLFVSVVVPVYNDSVRLTRCLEALEVQTYPKEVYEVIVVDNASEQDIRSVVCLFPGAVYTCENHPGPAAARNKGVALSKGDVIAFTDSDCLPQADWIEKGVEKILSGSGVDLVGGEIETYFDNPEKPTLVEVFHQNYFKQKELIENRHFSAGANLFVRRGVFETAGLFDTSFSLCACEDREWGERVYEKGYRIQFAKGAVVMHPSRSTLSQLGGRIMEFAVGNHQYETLRHRLGRGTPPASLSRVILALIKPPVRSAVVYLNQVHGFRRKIGIYLIVLFDHYLRVWANFVIRLGWQPQRRSLRKNWSG